MSPVEVSIAGQSELHRYPERGILNVEISSNGLSQKDVSDDVRSAAERVNKQLEALYDVPVETDAAITYYTINDLVTSFDSKYTRNKKGEILYDDDGLPVKQWLEYEASISCEIIFRDFAKLSEVATTLSVTKYVRIRSTNWIILEETEKSMVAESVRSAYAHALVKAQAYADQMDLRTVRAVKINDDGDSSSSQARSSHGRAKQTARRAGGRPALPSGPQFFTFAPKMVTLSGTCQVDFEIF